MINDAVCFCISVVTESPSGVSNELWVPALNKVAMREVVEVPVVSFSNAATSGIVPPNGEYGLLVVNDSEFGITSSSFTTLMKTGTDGSIFPIWLIGSTLSSTVCAAKAN